MDHIVTIELFGKPYCFKSDAPKEQAEAVADSLVRAVEKAEAQQPEDLKNMSRTAVLISAALNIANDYNELMENYTVMQNELQLRTDRLIRLLNTRVQ